MQETDDFFAESEALAGLVNELPDLSITTQFKSWRIVDVVGHLAIWNEAASLTYRDPSAFATFIENMMANFQSGGTLRDYEARLLTNLTDDEIRDRWWASAVDTYQCYADVDPKHRVAWGGPAMSVRSCISARLMETWAHAQAIYDVVGRVRVDTDRLRHIVMLGLNTIGFNFSVHGDSPPDIVPTLILEAPSGETWTFGDLDTNECIQGTATEFCQVVTQVRHIADTELAVSGPIATRWMAIAQCFAGPATTPPAPGSRFRIN